MDPTTTPAYTRPMPAIGETAIHPDAAQALIAVAEQGSILAAARALRASRTTLRRHLEGLEQLVGAPLLHREGRRLRLTPAGEVLLQHARHLTERSRLALLEARAAATEAGGLIRVGLAPGMPQSTVTAVLLQVRSAKLKVRLQLRALPTEGSWPHAELDMAFHFGPAPALEGWFSRVLRRLPVRLAASPDYLAERGHPQDIDALRQHPLLLWRGPQQAPDCLPLLKGDALRVSPFLVSEDVGLLRRAATAGLGIAFAPDADVQEDPGIGPLQTVLEGQVERTEVFRVTSRLPGRMDPRAAALMERVYELIRELPAD